VEGTAMPSLSLKNVKIAMSAATSKAPARHSATALLVQENAPEQLVSNVPIYAVNSVGDLTYVGRFFADGPETEITATVPADAKRLLVDPYHTVLTRP
jgi:hypothetical protein